MSGGDQGTEALAYFTQIFALQEQLEAGGGGSGSRPAPVQKKEDERVSAAEFIVPKTVFAPAGLLGG
ncbi:hypothetical protein D3C71_2137860 [compost metagenome]